MFDDWRALATWVFDQVFPAECMGCSATIPEAIGFCVPCRSLLERNGTPVLGELPLLAPYRFTGPVAKAIHRLKYEERSEYARRLVGDVAFSGFPSWLEGATLVPVPIHPARLVERGYDQAGLLARSLAHRWGLAVDLGLLRRVRFIARQVGLDREARRVNVRGAFEVRRAPLIGRAWPFIGRSDAPSVSAVARVVLVDDVVTTGATIRACVDALDAARIQVVGVVAVARAVKP
jgi:ComF family protein